LQRYSPTNLCDGAQMASFGDFFASCVFSEPRAAGFRKSDLHLKFALRPHHVWKVWQTSNLRRLRIRLGEEKKKKNKLQHENMYGLPYSIGRP